MSDTTLDIDAPPRLWRYVVLHHSGTESGSVASIDQEHRGRVDADGNHWRGIGYHFVIGNGHGMSDGAVVPTFRWREQLAGAHAGKALYNEQGVGICLIGDFEHQRPTERQLAACHELVERLRGRYELAPAAVVRHGDLKPTSCPGKLFPASQFEQIVPLAANHAAGATGALQHVGPN